MQKCNRCKVEKPFKEFSKNKTRPSGICPECKECAKTRAKIRYQKEGAKLRAQMALLRETDYEKRISIERASRARRKEAQRPAKNVRQRLRNTILSDKKYLIREKELRKLYSQPCFSCGSTSNQSIDHIMPISKGGAHSIGNLMTLCRKCNSSKHDKLFYEWKLKTKGFGGN